MLQTVHKTKRRMKYRQPSKRRAIADDMRLQERNERNFMRAFNALARTLVTDEILKVIERELRTPYATMMSVINAVPFFDINNPNTYHVWTSFAVKLETAYQDIFEDVAREEFRRMGVKLTVDLTKSLFPIRKARPVEFIRTRAFQQSINLSDTEKDRLSAIIGNGLQRGTHPDVLVEEIKATVGLTPKQLERVQRKGAAALEAGFSQRKIEQIKRKFADELRTHRARTIARTESVEAITQGRQEAWRVADEEGYMPDNAKKKWVTTFDDSTSDICDELDGQTVGVNEQFYSGILGQSFDGPPAHPWCRSTTVLVFGE